MRFSKEKVLEPISINYSEITHRNTLKAKNFPVGTLVAVAEYNRNICDYKQDGCIGCTYEVEEKNGKKYFVGSFGWLWVQAREELPSGFVVKKIVRPRKCA